MTVSVKDYHEHALGRGADATAMAYVEVANESGDALFGGGTASEHHERVVAGNPVCGEPALGEGWMSRAGLRRADPSWRGPKPGNRQ